MRIGKLCKMDLEIKIRKRKGRSGPDWGIYNRKTGKAVFTGVWNDCDRMLKAINNVCTRKD